jgi:hypothetical protein
MEIRMTVRDLYLTFRFVERMDPFILSDPYSVCGVRVEKRLGTVESVTVVRSGLQREQAVRTT